MWTTVRLERDNEARRQAPQDAEPKAHGDEVPFGVCDRTGSCYHFPQANPIVGFVDGEWAGLRSVLGLVIGRLAVEPKSQTSQRTALNHSLRKDHGFEAAGAHPRTYSTEGPLDEMERRAFSIA
jgi:hypothetical protein